LEEKGAAFLVANVYTPAWYELQQYVEGQEHMGSHIESTHLIDTAGNVEDHLERPAHLPAKFIADPKDLKNFFKVTRASKSFLGLSQYDAGETLGRDVRFLRKQVPTPEDKESLILLREILAQGLPRVILVENERKDGSLFWNKMSLWPIMGDEHRKKAVVRWVVVMADVSALHKEHVMKGPLTQVIAGSKAWCKAIRDMTTDIGPVFGVAEPTRGDGSDFEIFKADHRWCPP